MLCSLRNGPISTMTSRRSTVHRTLHRPVNDTPLGSIIRTNSAMTVVIDSVAHLIRATRVLPIVISRLGRTNIQSRRVAIIATRKARQTRAPRRSIVIYNRSVIGHIGIIDRSYHSTSRLAGVKAAARNGSICLSSRIIRTSGIVLANTMSFRPVTNFNNNHGTILPNITDCRAVVHGRTVTLASAFNNNYGPQYRADLLRSGPLRSSVGRTTTLLGPYFLIGAIFSTSNSLCRIINNR